MVGELGVEHVDLNFGCPTAKVTRKGGGAALPVRRARCSTDIVAAAVHAAGAGAGHGEVPQGRRRRPISRSCTPVARPRPKVAAVALHARTAWQHYTGEADWAAIAELKQAVSAESLHPRAGQRRHLGGRRRAGHDAHHGLRRRGGRAGLPGPPLAVRRPARAVLSGRTRPPPPRSLGVVADVDGRARRCCSPTSIGDELNAMRDFRKHTGWYLTGYPVGPDVRRRFAQVSSLVDSTPCLPASIAGDDRGRRRRAHPARPRRRPDPRRPPVRLPRRPAGALEHDLTVPRRRRRDGPLRRLSPGRLPAHAVEGDR